MSTTGERMEATSNNTVVERNVRTLSIGNTLAVSVNSLWIMFIPYYFTDLGITPVILGLLFTFFTACSGITQIFGGRIADSVGRRPAMLLGYGMYALGPLIVLLSLWMALSQTTLAVILAIFGYAWMMLGRGIARPASSMLLVESSRQKKKGRSYMLASRVFPSIPPALLVLVGSRLLFMEPGDNTLTGMFWLSLLIGFLGLLVMEGYFFLSLKETLHHKDPFPAPQRESLGIDRKPIFLLLLIVAFAFDAMSSSGLSWYVPLTVVDIDEHLYSWMISASTLVIALAALGAGEVVDKLGTRAALTIGWILLSLTIMIFPFFTDPWIIVFLYSIWAGLDMMDLSIPPLVFEERYPKEIRATMMGTFSTSISLLSILGPTLVSLTLFFGPTLPFLLKGTLNLCGVAIFLVAMGRATS